MGDRATFKFFRSFYDAAVLLPDKETQADFLLAVCKYALDNEAPDVTGTAAAMFALVKPNIDASRAMAESGSVGGKKTQANVKGGSSQLEAPSKGASRVLQGCFKGASSEEGSRKKEVGSKDVGGKPPKAPQGGSTGFERFWAAYPKKVGKEAAKKAFSKVKVPVESLLAAIERQKCSDQWSKDNGQFIPNPTTWLNQGRWEDELPSSSSGVQATGTFAPGDFERQSAERLRRIRDSLKGDES
jgi:hypothetical protein